MYGSVRCQQFSPADTHTPHQGNGGRITVRTSPRATARGNVPGISKGGLRSRIRPDKWRLAILGVTLTVATALIGVLIWPAQSGGVKIHQSAARVRLYSPYTACLLTGPKGLADPVAAPVWAGLREASASTTAQISYLTIMGPDTTANAETYINTMALRGCSTILAAGAVPADGALKAASSWSNRRLIAIEPASAEAKPPGNLTVIGRTAPAALAAQIKTLVTGLAEPYGGRAP
jgi:hypothetical protein